MKRTPFICPRARPPYVRRVRGVRARTRAGAAPVVDPSSVIRTGTVRVRFHKHEKIAPSTVHARATSTHRAAGRRMVTPDRYKSAALLGTHTNTDVVATRA